MVSSIDVMAGAPVETDLRGTRPPLVLAERTREVGWTQTAEGADAVDTAAPVEAGAGRRKAFIDVMLAGVPIKAWPTLADDERVGDDTGPTVGTRVGWAEIHQLAVLPWKRNQSQRDSQLLLQPGRREDQRTSSSSIF